ncbi:MAG: ABC transporter substrate-binding protein, partial [Chloroflexota bacterium]|nr:ABC transporter substrate-binding protein [Chloroflexota bacterium]
MAALLFALPPLLAGCAPAGGATSTAGAGAPVTLALDWTPNTNHTGIYAAMAKGYYQQQGINLRLT